ncbi:hypothetical protein Naga_101696g2 [Nannochloropsis gaditana]|uniref:Uncharacterized protein n=1 Tax=Nannochloropsis gaditana TaxID=72520 RepID=W7T0M3_9STRA|nr:hypothetical protein Naga_101696g2 [Nannochloropsis gaditana]
MREKKSHLPHGESEKRAIIPLGGGSGREGRVVSIKSEEMFANARQGEATTRTVAHEQVVDERESERKHGVGHNGHDTGEQCGKG